MAKWTKGQSGNPAGRPPKRVDAKPRSKKQSQAEDHGLKGVTVLHNDGFVNTITGVGTTRDKRTYTTHQTEVVVADLARDLWRGNDLAARCVETYPDEMTRQGWRFQCDDKDIAEQIETAWEELKVKALMRQLLCYENAYGGAAGLLGAIDNSNSWTRELKADKIREFKWITPLEAREVQPKTYYSNPLEAKFGEPKLWTICPQSPTAATRMVDVHESRLLIFPGIRVTRQHITENRGFGDSVLTRVWNVLRDFDMSWNSAGALLQDFAQAVFKLKGLPELMSNNQSSALRARMEMMDLSRSVLRAILIDHEEEFERKGVPLSGVPDLLDRLMSRMASAADLPITRLMGQSPAGLNATGESDIRGMYDRAKSKQENQLLPHLEKITTLLFPALGIKEPEDWSIHFNPLWQPSEKERADAREVQARTDQIYVDLQVISPEEIRNSRFEGDEYSFETRLDPAAHDAFMAEQEAAAQQELEMKAEQAKALAAGAGKQPPGKPGEKPAAKEPPPEKK